MGKFVGIQVCITLTKTREIEKKNQDMQTDSSITEINYATSDPDIKKIQEIVGGYFAVIQLTENQIMYVNEEGELKNLTFNKEASDIAGTSVYGNVLIVV